MPVQYVTGDLFKVGAPAIAHGVNCQGVMGSGIAPRFRNMWPDMYHQYVDECRAKSLRPGGVLPYQPTHGPLVLNLATQDSPGPHARLDWIENALKVAVSICYFEEIPELAIPRIGAGIGGLKWDDVKTVIERIAATTPILITVVTLPEQA